jgi:hypothetical protein
MSDLESDSRFFLPSKNKHEKEMEANYFGPNFRQAVKKVSSLHSFSVARERKKSSRKSSFVLFPESKKPTRKNSLAQIFDTKLEF